MKNHPKHTKVVDSHPHSFNLQIWMPLVPKAAPEIPKVPHAWRVGGRDLERLLPSRQEIARPFLEDDFPFGKVDCALPGLLKNSVGTDLHIMCRLCSIIIARVSTHIPIRKDKKKRLLPQTRTCTILVRTHEPSRPKSWQRSQVPEKGAKSAKVPT